MKSTQDHQNATDPFRIRVAGMVRRMAITLTTRALWQLTGFRMSDGRNEILTKVEAFLGIGFHARPSSSGKPEAIVVMVGADADTPVVVAVRDEKTRAAIADALKANETAVFNDSAILHITEDAEIHARSKAGTASSLLTVADGAALKSAIAGATTTANDGGAAFKAELVAALAGWPTGTVVLKGE